MKCRGFGKYLLFSALWFVIGCSPSPTGSAELDKVFKADYAQWAPLVEAGWETDLKEIARLNPHFDAGRQASITNRYQQVILSLLAIQKKEGVIVELGAWIGGGALMMAPFLTHQQSYHAVDTFNADTMPDPYIQKHLQGRKQVDVFKANIAPVREKVVIHQGTTNAVAAGWPPSLTIDLLFIDADHSYEAVRADWLNWSPFLKKGGIIVFHDYYVKIKGGSPGVSQWVDGSIINVVTKNLYYTEGLAWYVVQ
jgi:predicted O-methyltransferase YrrM